LVALRKAHPAFRMSSAEMINKNLSFLKTDPGIIAYQISNNANGDAWKNILVILNGNTGGSTFHLPAGKWTMVSDGDQINQNGIISGLQNTLQVNGTSAFVLYSN